VRTLEGMRGSIRTLSVTFQRENERLVYFKLLFSSKTLSCTGTPHPSRLRRATFPPQGGRLICGPSNRSLNPNLSPSLRRAHSLRCSSSPQPTRSRRARSGPPLFRRGDAKNPGPKDRGFRDDLGGNYTSWITAISAASRRRSMLHIVCPAFWQGAFISLLLLSPTDPLTPGSVGAPFISPRRRKNPRPKGPGVSR